MIKICLWNSCRSAAETNPTRNRKVGGLILGLAQWVKDVALLWLWSRSAAVAPIRPPAWEPPYAAGTALKSQKDKKQNQKQKPQKTKLLVIL